MSRYDVENTHKVLRNKLIEYVRAQYLGENDLLLNACDRILEKEGNLYRKPYIEANPAYVTVKNGIHTADIPDYTKDFLLDMADSKLGVFKDPFEHQVEALEYFNKGRNLFVTTGTGSGKTECFLWPLLWNLTEEASLRPRSWEMRGVRALLMYPMNALVSDQLGRLRRIIGDRKGQFRKVFKRNVNDKNVRIPQFGMYTGRTPYPGDKNDKKKDKKLAETLENSIANRDLKEIKELIKIGKYPAKADLKTFISALKSGEHITDENDAEMLTRFEMQKLIPDILITNYSMLEYMLLRPIEKDIWNNTKAWLDKDADNKLLIIIDEAHMYKGASGGEVALLLRRLMYRLGIGSDRIQFILTSASMPHDTKDDKKSIVDFANSFTGQSTRKDSFKLIFGSREKLTEKGSRSISVDELLKFDVDGFQSDTKSKVSAIEDFADKVCDQKVNFKNISQAEVWLYDNLPKYSQFIRLMTICRKKAATINELSNKCFPALPKVKAQTATQKLLTITPLAKKQSR